MTKNTLLKIGALCAATYLASWITTPTQHTGQIISPDKKRVAYVENDRLRIANWFMSREASDVVKPDSIHWEKNHLHYQHSNDTEIKYPYESLWENIFIAPFRYPARSLPLDLLAIIGLPLAVIAGMKKLEDKNYETHYSMAMGTASVLSTLIYPTYPLLPLIHTGIAALISGEGIEGIKKIAKSAEQREEYLKKPRHTRNSTLLERVLTPGTGHFSLAKEQWEAGNTQEALLELKQGVKTRAWLEGDHWIELASMKDYERAVNILLEQTYTPDFEKNYAIIEALQVLLPLYHPGKKQISKLEKIAGEQETLETLIAKTITKLHVRNAKLAINTPLAFESIGNNSTLYKVPGRIGTYVLEASEDIAALKQRMDEAEKTKTTLAPYPHILVPGYIELLEHPIDGRYYLVAKYSGKPLNIAGTLDNALTAMELCTLLHVNKRTQQKRNSTAYALVVQERLKQQKLNTIMNASEFLWEEWAKIPQEDEKPDLDFLAEQTLVTNDGRIALIDPQDKGTKFLWCDVAKFIATCGYRQEYVRFLQTYFEEVPIHASYRLLVGAAVNSVNFTTQKANPKTSEKIHEFYKWLATEVMETRLRSTTYEKHLALAEEIMKRTSHMCYQRSHPSSEIAQTKC